MNANSSQRFPHAIALAASLLLAGSCSEPRTEAPVPMPAPVPPAPPAPPPPQPLQPSQVDWREARITPGDWVWSAREGLSAASFAGGKLILQCAPDSRTITMLRAGEAADVVPMTVETSSVRKPLLGNPVAGPPPAISVTFDSKDPLLDAMAFSRGRFAVEAAGLETLYVPSWTEVSRVIEDCR